jgi:hypothetical protein
VWEDDGPDAEHNAAAHARCATVEPQRLQAWSGLGLGLGLGLATPGARERGARAGASGQGPRHACYSHVCALPWTARRASTGPNPKSTLTLTLALTPNPNPNSEESFHGPCATRGWAQAQDSAERLYMVGTLVRARARASG